ncbi:MAG: aminotransferase class III-fold pyridoxal phosphate-dependent enzyme [Halieaceae bacterium]|jgi:4-aminobutyrate---pyruvate transaminase|nr:aminotransferase class III-fold pyridoxal phosphate-dependent enzyme [Halieaceae bacterium]
MTGTATNKAHVKEPTLLMGFTNLRDLRTTEPLVITRGEGVFIYDEAGKDYIEGASSFYCTSLGFSEQALIDAAVEQMQQIPFYISAAQRKMPVVQALADKIAAMVPIANAKVAFHATGSEANDALIKFMWYHNHAMGEPARRKVITRDRSYHGGTIVTTSMTGWSGYNADYGLPLEGFLQVSQPDFFNLAIAGETEEEFASRMVAEVEALIQSEGPETVGAFVAEPVSVSAGLAIPPATYFDKLTAMLRQYNIRFFADEVVTGFCRTGNMFGCETYGINPDCMTVAKALSSAYQPISAVIMSEDFYTGLEEGSARAGMFSHAGTYHGHPVAAAVALRTLELIEERDILGHVRSVGPYLHHKLCAYAEHPLVKDVRSVGLTGALQLALDGAASSEGPPEPEIAHYLGERCREHGLFLRPTGGSIVFAPPLIITSSEIDELFSRFDAALAETLSWAHSQWPQ